MGKERKSSRVNMSRLELLIGGEAERELFEADWRNYASAHTAYTSNGDRQAAKSAG